MKFEVVQDNYEFYLAAPLACARCQRTFRAGERVRMVVSAPVERVWPHMSYALLNIRHVHQRWEHENPEHCTEERTS